MKRLYPTFVAPWGTAKITEKDILRFRSFVREAPSGCWIWRGGGNWNDGSRSKYPVFSIGGYSVRAHRFSYQAFVGKILPALQVDHICRTTMCVNPAHLRAVTPRENTLYGIGPSAQNARKIKCIKGHPFSGFNLLKAKTGSRICRACKIIADKRFNATRKARAKVIARDGYSEAYVKKLLTRIRNLKAMVDNLREKK